jgi:hypothetical protein
MYNKLIANIIINGKKQKPFTLKSETIQGNLLSPLFFNIELESFARSIR